MVADVQFTIDEPARAADGLVPLSRAAVRIVAGTAGRIRR